MSVAAPATLLRRTEWSRHASRLVVVGVFVAAGAAAWSFWPWLSARLSARSPAPPSAAADGPTARVALVPDRPDTVRVPKSLFATGRFATAAAEGAPAPEPLRLVGTLIADPNRQVRVQSLFSGSVVKMGLKGDLSATSERLSSVPDTGLRPGDMVRKGQILCVIWSKDVGAMKTDLVNQMSKLRADQKVLERYESVPKGVVTENQLTQARQQVETDLVLVRNAERNLRSAQFTEAEIAVVRREGEKLNGVNSPADLEVDRTWAEMPIRAQFDGVLVEVNVTVGQVIDPTTVLFKVANLDRLQVLANVYEEDLPKLRQIDEEAQAAEAAATPPGGTDGSPGFEAQVRAAGERVRAWTIGFQAAGEGATEAGAFEKISPVVDPMMHTGTVTGWVDNTRGRLFVGQFVTVTVPLKPDPKLVAVPAAAVAETADGPVVFVRSGAADDQFTRRNVAVAVRGRGQILLRQPTPDEAKRGVEAVRPCEVVLSRGVVELVGELDSLQSEAKP